MAHDACPTCGTPFQGTYCAVCGEKRLGPHDLSLGHYAHELLHGFTHADGKLLKTLRALLLRPGELTRAYMEGRRRPYMRPVNLFVVLNLIYFLVPLFELFNTSLHSQLNFMPHSALAARMVHGTVTATGADLAAYEQVFTPRSAANAKLMLVLLVFILALPLALLYRRKARPSGHVAFAFEAMSFNLLSTAILLALALVLAQTAARLLGYPPEHITDDGVVSTLAFVLNLYFFFAAGRRFHRCTVPGALWRALLAFPLFFIALSAYRFLLFLVSHLQTAHALGG
jgi:hypothetical protein